MMGSMSGSSKNNRNYTPLVVGLSIVVNAVILLLFFSPIGYSGEVGFDIKIFPRLNAVFNSFTFIFLLAALYTIKKGNVKLHKRFVLSAFTTTLLFCVSYLTYHYLSVETTRYGGEGFLRYFYFFILITHSILAAIIVPLALFSLIWGWTNQLDKHRKIVRWSMPIWLYVSFTGVLVYLLISPYY
jgi:putative membrane protein